MIYMSISYSLIIIISLINTPFPLFILVLLTMITLALYIITIYSSWIAIITYLIYVGGLIVLFIFFINQGSNTLSYNRSALIFLVTFTQSITLPQPFNIYCIPSVTIILSKPIFFILSTIFLSLFLLLIVVVSIVSKREGALRPFS